MPESARIDDIESLKLFRRALWKFAETANVALGDAESEMQRVLLWLETEQRSYWQHQHRLRQDALMKAKDALRQKKLFKDSTGKYPSAVDEEKAVALAQRKLDEAEQKIAAIRRYVPLLRREIQMYKGSVQRFATTVQVDVPSAVHTLDRVTAKLEEYVALSLQPDGPAAAGAGAAETVRITPALLADASARIDDGPVPGPSGSPGVSPANPDPADPDPAAPTTSS
jgi:hypothetical protein